METDQNPAIKGKPVSEAPETATVPKNQQNSEPANHTTNEAALSKDQLNPEPGAPVTSEDTVPEDQKNSQPGKPTVTEVALTKDSKDQLNPEPATPVTSQDTVAKDQQNSQPGKPTTADAALSKDSKDQIHPEPATPVTSKDTAPKDQPNPETAVPVKPEAADPEDQKNLPANQSDLAPIALLNFTDKHDFTTKEDDLNKLLLRDDVKDTPVAVISIAGAFRGGKSFMLDYFLRYLQAPEEKRRDGTWIGDKDQPLKGFSWRGGSERNTRGILIWPEPYFVTLESGERVCVLLVDTQGIYDNESTVQDYSTIFAFSILISSTILFNVRDNIKEDDLTHLNLFSKFGEAIHSNKDKTYQNLKFLVRDFPFPYETPYGSEGGQTLVNKRLEIKEDQEDELRDVRKNILASFEKITGFLMPHPGFGVMKSNYDGRWAVLEEDFITYLHALMDCLFSPSKLEAKKLRGQVVTGKELLEIINTFVGILKRGETPKLGTITKMTIESSLRLGVRDALASYKRDMDVEVGDSKPSLPAAGVFDIHNKRKKAAVNMFMTTKTMATQEEKELYVAQLQKDIELNLQDYLITNHVKLQKAIADGEKAYKDHITSVHRDDPICLLPDDLKEVHDQALNLALRAFDSQRRQVPGIPDDERYKFLKNFEKNYDQLRSENNLNSMGYVDEILLSYNSVLEAKLVVDPPISTGELEEVHERELKRAKDTLDGKRNRQSSDAEDLFKTTMVERIRKSFSHFMSINRRRNQERLNLAFNYYKNAMYSYWDPNESYSVCVPVNALIEKHEEVKRRAARMLRTNTCSYDDDECNLLSLMIDSEFDGIAEQNRNANQRFEDRAYKIYRNKMDDLTSFNGWWVVGFGIPYLVNKSKRWDYHLEAKTKAENYFENHRSVYGWDSYDSSLLQRINFAYNHYYA